MPYFEAADAKRASMVRPQLGRDGTSSRRYVLGDTSARRQRADGASRTIGSPGCPHKMQRSAEKS